MNRIAGRTGITLLLVVALLAGMVFFSVEYAMYGNDWATFTGSPHVYNGINIGCGVISDRDGVVLLDTQGEWTYSSDVSVRKSTLHWLGDRVGYISAPALSHYAEELAGFDSFNGVYTYADAAGKASLTISAELQTLALEAMGDRKGTLAVYNYKTGEILCAVTTPTYDPDNVPDINDEDEAYDGIYLNRFVQSSYVPGSIFKVVTLAAALEKIHDVEERTFICEGSYYLGGSQVTCERTHGELSLKSAFARSCNCAFAQLAQEIGSEGLNQYVKQFGITDSISFDGITTAQGNFDVSSGDAVELAWSAIGQFKDQINPCSYMTFMGAIAGGGSAARPYLVEEIKVGNSRTYSADTTKGGKIMSADTAKTLQEYMRNNVEAIYGADNFPGLTVCAKSGTAELGGDQKSNAMFSGFVMDEEYPLAFIVAVENGGYGSHVCVPIIAPVLQACKDLMDQG